MDLGNSNICKDQSSSTVHDSIIMRLEKMKNVLRLYVSVPSIFAVQSVDRTHDAQNLAETPHHQFLGAWYCVISLPKVSKISTISPRKYKIAYRSLLTGSDQFDEMLVLKRLYEL